ncbi:MAG: hypothetical protein JSW02_02145 [candidate division WOR-3 bacterium]|nr:MAG: hypothetical protein JSW02_02145 [candidate division WOR-3 bacterium]
MDYYIAKKRTPEKTITRIFFKLNDREKTHIMNTNRERDERGGRSEAFLSQQRRMWSPPESS